MSDAKRPTEPSGSLREALIASAIAILNQDGPRGLTLRRVAARAGVSHAAPAHHFQGLAGLLTAVATRGFDLFTAYLEAGAAREPSDATAALEAICAGYLRFSDDHAGLFHVLFVAPEVDRTDPDFDRASAAAYAVLRQRCLPFSRDGAPDPVLETAVWSLVHGYALLGLNAPQGAKRRPQAVPEFRALLARLLGR